MWPSDQDGSLAPDGQLGEATLRENLGKRLGYWWNMIFSENRCTPRIKCGAGFLGITFYFSAPAVRPGDDLVLQQQEQGEDREHEHRGERHHAMPVGDLGADEAVDADRAGLQLRASSAASSDRRTGHRPARR